MPIIIPYLVLIISFYLVVGPIIDNPQIEYLYALSFIFAGLIFYVPFVKFGLTPRFMSKENDSLRNIEANDFYAIFPVADKITLFLQLLLEVVPTTTMGMFD